MWDRRSLRFPIILGVVLLVLLVLVTVGWVLLAVFGALANEQTAPLYWTFLTVGSSFLVALIVGVSMHLTLTIKTINLNRRQSNFMDSITHELKSPIASLKLYLQTLNRRPVTPEEQARFYQFMLEDVERLDGLINHVLDAARLDRPAAESEAGVENVELAPLLRECVQEVASRYRMSADAIQVRIEPSVVRARRVDLAMIFRNLVDNAVKYAGSPPEVRVESRPRLGGSVEVLVIDNGPGIPARHRRRIFARFVRLGSELERSKPGTGLGLYIVHTLVERLKGKVRVRDRGDQPGTIFEVILPGWTAEITPPAAALRTSETRANLAPESSTTDVATPPVQAGG